MLGLMWEYAKDTGVVKMAENQVRAVTDLFFSVLTVNLLGTYFCSKCFIHTLTHLTLLNCF